MMQLIIWKEQPGLYDAIVAAGYYVEHTQNGTFADDAAAVQKIVDSYTSGTALAFAKAAKTREILQHAKYLRDKVVATISAGEMASWGIKRDEALRFDVDGELPESALLALEAMQRGLALADLVAKVKSNGARFEAAEAAIAGADGRHRDTVAVLGAVDQVVNYNYLTGWPEV
jgi:hypothetical protein